LQIRDDCAEQTRHGGVKALTWFAFRDWTATCEKGKIMRRILLLVLLLLVPVLAVVMKTMGQAKANAHVPEAQEKWEYLVLAGPGNTNFDPTGNSDMRKQEGSFAREGFVLETQLDKVGAKGWELVSVAGPPQNPIYYFKRRVGSR
jgi:hypothetical protein